ncbi:LytR/AlgR family response regulator transcription factor [Taibaiella koreensis]|uniref:LytR/AlgR family response regulator transcription factor n=1 Tax=Taibaiella koreensis TaxID=1268548 RepID=UPI000E59C4D5|nr:LytTR family DNA-binding domain-containing protein [Taibaiella koreensis]
MNKISTVIIDDEYESRKILQRFLVKYCPDIKVVAEASCIDEAIVSIRDTAPELVFLDINMPRENGFQLFNKLSGIDFYTVFVTAYDSYALQAFRHHALDYLLKPIDIDQLIVTVNRVKQLRDDKQQAQQLKGFFESFRRLPELPKIALPVLEGFIYVHTADIVRCEANSNYTYVYLTGGKKVVVSKTLAVYEELLKDHGFARVHHQHLINLKYVEKYVRGRGGLVIMSDKKEIQVSSRKKEEFLRLIGGMG